jgi:hypothetical protein
VPAHGHHSWLRYFAVLVLYTALATGHAHAESPAGGQVALLPAIIDRGVNRQLGPHALRAMQDFLLDHGYALVDARKLNNLPAALRGCKDQRCMPKVHRALGADHVIAVELHRADAGTALHLQWNDAGFVAYTSEVTLATATADAAENAGQEALRAALEKQRRGPGPWLSIAGTPDNAVVEINGKAVGTIPFLGRVDPGPTRVVVRKEGYEEHAAKVDVADAADAYQRLRVALTPKHAVSAAELRPLTREQLAAKGEDPKAIVALPAADERMRDDASDDGSGAPSFHPADVVIGSAFVLGGIALAIGPAQTWARDGKCWNPPECTQRVQFDGAQQAQLAGGIALAVVGVLWTFVLKPIGHASAPDHHPARAPESN